jgi:hypothetical protein
MGMGIMEVNPNQVSVCMIHRLEIVETILAKQLARLKHPDVCPALCRNDMIQNEIQYLNKKQFVVIIF